MSSRPDMLLHPALNIKPKEQSMKAGRELDALVAEKVMESAICAHCAADAAENPEDYDADWDKDLPHYSTDIAAAWQVVEKLVGKDCKEQDLFIECWADGEWFVAFHPLGYSSREPIGCCDGKESGEPSAPLAICRAALKSVGIDLESEANPQGN